MSQSTLEHSPAKSTQTQGENRRAHLMLRLFVPLEDMSRRMPEVLEICRQTQVGEILFFLDCSERYFGHPTLARCRDWANALRMAREALSEIGVRMSIHPWATLVHAANGYPVSRLGMTAMVGDDGAVATDSPCPADPVFQDYLAESFAILASAGPDILWLEDDFRLHNHVPVRFGCFATPMLDAFALRTGRQWERANLVEAIIANREDARSQWLRFTGDLWIELARRVRHAVHRVNPNVKLGQMFSSTASHSAEGRRGDEYLHALAGPHRPIARPHFGPYRDSAGFEFGGGIVLFRHGMALAGRETRFCPELESGPHSYFSKSNRQIALQMELMQYFGCRDITLNVFSMAGNDFRNEPWIAEMFRQTRPRLDALAALGMDRRIEQGVHVWTREDAALFQEASDRPLTLDSLRPAFDAWAKVFTRMGIASTFETKGELVAISGDTIRAADENELTRLLSGGLLIDGRAARALQEMGYGKYLGVEVGPRARVGSLKDVSIEQIIDPTFGLIGSPFMGLTQMGHDWRDFDVYFSERKGARAITELRTGDLNYVAPGVTLFENELGGRVAVFPYDFDSGVADSVRFYHEPRRRQVLAVLRWLNRDQSFIASSMQTMIAIEVMKLEEVFDLAAVNLSGDPIQELQIQLPMPPQGQVEILDNSAVWAPIEMNITESTMCVSLSEPLQPMQAAFLKWE